MASWLVAPKWTQRAASGSRDATRSVSARTSGMAGLPAEAVSSPSDDEVEELGAAGVGDRLGGRRAGCTPARGQGPGQRRLEVEHPLHPGAVRGDGPQALGGEERVEEICHGRAYAP